MQKDKESQNSNLAFDNSALILKEEQDAEAISLEQSQMKTARLLKIYNDNTAENLLSTDRDIRQTPEESRWHAAITLARTQSEAATMLKDSQSRAAKNLGDSLIKAAASLRASHTQATDTHEEKNEVISWLGGGYSVNYKHDK